MTAKKRDTRNALVNLGSISWTKVMILKTSERANFFRHLNSVRIPIRRIDDSLYTAISGLTGTPAKMGRDGGTWVLYQANADI